MRLQNITVGITAGLQKIAVGIMFRILDYVGIRVRLLGLRDQKIAV